MQTRRTRRFRPTDFSTLPAAPVRPAAPAEESAPPVAAGFAARRPRRAALGGDPGRVWRVAVLVVLAAVAFRPLSALCQLIVEEYHKAAVAAGFAPTREEVADTRPALLAETVHTSAAPSAAARPTTPVTPVRATESSVFSSWQPFQVETANPYARPIVGGTASFAPAPAANFSLAGVSSPARPAVRSRAAAVVPQAAGGMLIVDQSAGNSPYPINASDTFATVFDGTTGVGVITQAAYTLTVSGTLYLGFPGGSSTTTTGNGTYNLSGGTLATVTTQLGNYGTGTFNQTGGTNTISGTLYLGLNNGMGTFNLGGTGRLSTGAESVGYSGTGTFNQTGGTNTISGEFHVGDKNGTGTYNFGGTGTPDTLSAAQGIVVGYDGSGIFNQTGGTATAGNATFLGYNSGSQGAYNLNGGLVNTPAVVVGGGTGGGGAGTFNFNGGTLQASASDNPGAAMNPTTFFSGVTTANVRNGGAVIDTNGFNVTVASVLAHSTLGTLGNTVTVGSGGSGYTSAPTVTVMGGGGYGATAVATINAQGQVTGVTLTNPGTNYTSAPTFSFSGSGGSGAAATDPFTADNAIDGGLTKMGAGTLTLTGNNTYTGNTSVNAGTLAITAGNVGPSGSNATFAVDGSTTTPPAATLSGSATLNVGALNVGVSGGGMFTQSGGTITMPGTGNGFDLGVNAGSNGTFTMTGGQFTDAGAKVGDKGTGSFIQSGGVHDISTSALYIGNQTGGNGSYTLSGTGQLLTAETVVGSSGTGLFTQTGGTATATNFLAVGFNSANGTYNLSGGSLISAGVTYLGDGTTGTGTINQSGNSTFTTPLLLFTSTTNQSVQGTYNLNGGVLNVGVVSNGATGTGSTSTSTFRFNGGTLKASASDNPGAASNPTTFFSGVTNAYVGAGGAVIDTNSFNVTIASQLTEDPAALYSDGGLTKNGAGTLTLGNQNIFYGPVMVNGGTLQAGATAYAFGQGNTAVMIANVAGATLALNGNYEQIGSLAGGGTTGGTVVLTGGTLDTGNDNTNTTFAGTITGNGGLIKDGTGMFTVTANNTYSGTTVVASGALMVCNVPTKAGDSGTGTGPVYVGQGAWLGGTGTIGGNVTVGAYPPNTSGANGVQPRFVSGSGTLTPGVAVGGVSTPGRLTINGSLTFTSGTSLFEVDLAGANAGTGYDQVRVGGSLTLAGTLTLTTGVGFTPTALEKFYLIDLTGTGTTSGTFDGLAQGALVTDSAGNEYRISYLDHDPADTSNLLFDDVSLTAFSVVPEPSTWAFCALGAGLVGLLIRRQRCRA